jgi:L-iditol 2-dehydrogenase
MYQPCSPASSRELGGLMKAHVLLQPGEIQFGDVPRPRPDPDGVVVRVRAALTCGTDVKAFLRGHPKFPMPTLFGHEFSGEVAEVGSRVRGFREGDAVMAVPSAPCGSCYYCDRRQENLCPRVMDSIVLGAYAEYIKLPAHIVDRSLYRKPGQLSYEEGALLEPLACVLHGLAQITVRPDDTVVLIGAGAIALLHLLVLKHRGVDAVLVSARSERRAEQAKKLGADEILVGGHDEVRDRILLATGGRGADVVIECTGQVEIWEYAPSLARRGGQVILFGGCPSNTAARFDTGRLHYDEVRIISPFHFAPRDVQSAYELLSDGDLGAGALISDAYPLERLAEALMRHRRGEGAKFAIIPSCE